RRNAEIFQNAMKMFNPFALSDFAKPDEPSTSGGEADLDTMKRQLAEMQARLDKMGKTDD
ncbi:MAG: polyhydroxyalkanoate synthesis repressor PhaR, partial [Pseudomonadota bacterium]